MPQSLANVLVHIIFSTKNRFPFINVEVEEELYAYPAKVARECGCPAPKIGGTDDHVHIACSLGRTVTIAHLVEQLKTSTSKWIKTKGGGLGRFAWQNGYGAFSIGQSQLTRVKAYIGRQREHHRRKTFQEERGPVEPVRRGDGPNFIRREGGPVRPGRVGRAAGGFKILGQPKGALKSQRMTNFQGDWKGDHVLRVRIAGANDKAVKSCMFGLDEVILEPAAPGK